MQQILIVDDDDVMRLVMRECLSDTYGIIETGDPQAALAIAVQRKPDAILMDLSMPGLSGFELCQAISSLSITQHIPIIIVSGEDERNKAFCLKLGASSYLTKPVDLGKLKAQLEQILSSKKDDRRAHVRVPLRVTLELRGANEDGTELIVSAVTENMSKGGFLCSCDSPLAEGAAVEVTLCGERHLSLGYARLVRVIMISASNTQFGFQFISSTEAVDLLSQLRSNHQ